MRNIHIKEVRPRPQADDDVVWNSLPKVALDLEDILVHYEDKKKVIKTKIISYHNNAHSRAWQN